MAARCLSTKAASLRGTGPIGAFEHVFRPFFSRTFATEAASPVAVSSSSAVKILPAEPPAPQPFAIRKAPTVLATVHSFPDMEPLRFESYPSTFLHSPLRRDILHKAVVYEGDAHRLGRAKTKSRYEVRGSSRKVRQQKHTGAARMGDRNSPILRGGGVAHGPKPRDFSSGLPRKMYDLAWRTALSYRYKRSELVIVEDSLEVQEGDPGLVKAIMDQYKWGHDHDRSLFITTEERPNLEVALGKLGTHGRVLVKEDVDVKDLLELGRIIIEKDALEWFRTQHGSATQ